jgi:cell division septation protein DedD
MKSSPPESGLPASGTSKSQAAVLILLFPLTPGPSFTKMPWCTSRLVAFGNARGSEKTFFPVGFHMYLRRISLRAIFLICFCALLFFSMWLASPDLKKLLHRVTGLGSQSVPAKEETEHIVNRASIKIDSARELPAAPSESQEATKAPHTESPSPAAEPLAAIQPELEIQKPTDSLKKAPEERSAEKVKQPYFSLHIGSFRELQNASAEAERLKSSELDAFWKKVAIPGKGEWFRVYVGKHKTRDEALGSGKELKAKGIIEEFFVHEMKPAG